LTEKRQTVNGLVQIMLLCPKQPLKLRLGKMTATNSTMTQSGLAQMQLVFASCSN